MKYFPRFLHFIFILIIAFILGGVTANLTSRYVSSVKISQPNTACTAHNNSQTTDAICGYFNNGHKVSGWPVASKDIGISPADPQIPSAPVSLDWHLPFTGTALLKAKYVNWLFFSFLYLIIGTVLLRRRPAAEPTRPYGTDKPVA